MRLCNADVLRSEAEVCFHADVHTRLGCQPFSCFPLHLLLTLQLDGSLLNGLSLVLALMAGLKGG